MILLGGVTRLTDSGLSMVEWQPIMGVIPPLNEADWLVAFAKYQQYPEFQKVNYAMDLAGFKVIFLYEYLHRVLGRLIGLLYLAPMVFFHGQRHGAATLSAQIVAVSCASAAARGYSGGTW